MRVNVMAAVIVKILVGITLFQGSRPAAVRAQDKGGRQLLEYRIVFSPIAHLRVKESRKVDGKLVEIEHGPRASAEAMTKQFNELAAQGWEYVGPIAASGKQDTGDGSTGVLSLFKRTKH